MSDYEDDLEYEEQNGDTGSCAVCGQEIEYYEGFLGDFWTHAESAVNLDGHQAELGGPA